MNNYKQLCVWPGTVLDDSTVEDFEQFFLDELGVRVKYAEEVKTQPDPGETYETSGNRNDVLFWVHDEDVSKFAIPRLKMSIRWWEDVVSYNNGSYLYSEDILNKYPVTW